MRKKTNTSLSKEELEDLHPKTHRDLKLLSFFYYECIMPYRTGIIKKVTPIKMHDTLIEFYKNTGEEVPGPHLTPAHD